MKYHIVPTEWGSENGRIEREIPSREAAEIACALSPGCFEIEERE